MSKLLTPLELKVMNILWDISKGFVRDILDHWEEDEEKKPAYNTVSTIVRILKDKEYVDVIAHGRSHEYFPLISRECYQEQFLDNAISNVFQGKLNQLVSTLIDSEQIDQQELSALKQLIERKKQDQQ
ncbi:MAG: BlaI/MecI/CopY family transcriptional regulator [Bacteroidota bacterium]